MPKTYYITGQDMDPYRELIPEEVFSPYLMLFVSVEDGSLTGILAVEPGGPGDIHIRYLFVSEKRRRKKTARALESHLFETVRIMGRERIMVNFVREDDEDDIHGFLTAAGYEIREETWVYELDLADTAVKVAEYAGGRPDVKTVSLKEAPTRYYGQLREALRERRNRSRSGGDLFMDPGPVERFDPDISFIALSGKGDPIGVILFRGQENDVILEYVCVLDGGAGDVFLDLLEAAANAVMDRAALGKKMYFHGVNRTVVRMAKKLGLEPKKVMESVWMEKDI